MLAFFPSHFRGAGNIIISYLCCWYLFSHFIHEETDTKKLTELFNDVYLIRIRALNLTMFIFLPHSTYDSRMGCHNKTHNSSVTCIIFVSCFGFVFYLSIIPLLCCIVGSQLIESLPSGRLPSRFGGFRGKKRRIGELNT